MTCPRCGAESVGNFCASCGSSLRPEPCTACGAQPVVGDRFCNTCGTFLEAQVSASGAPSGAESSSGQGLAKAGWWAAGAMLVAVILMASRSVLDRTPPAPAGLGSQPAGATGGGQGAVGAAAVDLASMTPREAADRLFNRVMRGVSSGNSPEVEGFLPMAVAAYERAQPLDADGTFHLALLHLTGLNFTAALASVEEALAGSPDHLLLLSAAAEASAQAGDTDAAAGFYDRILLKWDEQVALELEEYQVHATMLPEIEADAREFLAAGS